MLDGFFIFLVGFMSVENPDSPRVINAPVPNWTNSLRLIPLCGPFFWFIFLCFIVLGYCSMCTRLPKTRETTHCRFLNSPAIGNKPHVLLLSRKSQDKSFS